MRYLMLLSALLFVFGCARATEEGAGEIEFEEEAVVVEEAPAEEVVVEETPAEEAAVVEETPAVTEETTAPAVTEETPPATAETTVETPPPPPPGPKIGFRVQIGAFSVEANAQKRAEEARLRFVEPVYVEFIDGYYKVRVGDFLTREEAEACKERAKSFGYYDAFIVECEISP